MKWKRRFLCRRDGQASELVVETEDGRRATARTSQGETLLDCAALPDGRVSVVLPSGRQMTGRALEKGGRVEARLGARRLEVELSDPLRELAGEGLRRSAGDSEVRTQIPGRVIEVKVSPGDVVATGATLLVLEAMKMQNEIRAEWRGRVLTVECAPGQAVEAGAVLVRLESAPVA